MSDRLGSVVLGVVCILSRLNWILVCCTHNSIFFIDERIHTLHEMDCYFEISIVIFGDDDELQLYDTVGENIDTDFGDIDNDNTTKNTNHKIVMVKSNSAQPPALESISTIGHALENNIRQFVQLGSDNNIKLIKVRNAILFCV